MALRSDRELVRSVRQGERNAYAELLRRHERRVLAHVMNILRNRHAAEDAVQDAFIKAYERLGELRDGSKFGPWLMTTARRHALQLRDRRRDVLPLDADTRASPDSQSGLAADEVEQLLDAVAGLPKHEKAVISLRYFDGHGVREIAEITGKTVGTITKCLSRAHARLRRMIERNRHDDD